MTNDQRITELTALKEIAETLNRSYDMDHMLDNVLRKLLEVTGLTTAWIFMVDEEPDYSCVADQELPSALKWKDKYPMKNGSCWCVNKYWRKELHHAVNIIECKRITDAIQYKWGDTEGILHHATVPLKAGQELFGILNIAAPDKEVFDEEELALLESVAFQIGSAIKRSRLYHSSQKRALNYAKLGEVSQQITSILNMKDIPIEVVQHVSDIFSWRVVAFFIVEDDHLSLRAFCANGYVERCCIDLLFQEAGFIAETYITKKKQVIYRNDDTIHFDLLPLPEFQSAVTAPIQYNDHTYGVLLVSCEKRNAFDDNDVDVIQSISDVISLTMENARLYEQRKELAHFEERNRLARDLHDSVCQMLFSLSLTAKGAEMLLKSEDQQVNLEQALDEIQTLSQEALKEMRSLIWQLRPTGLEQGLITGICHYAQQLGLEVETKMKGVVELPRHIEEALYRIGQEALNNISKHAQTPKAKVILEKNEKEEVLFTVMDQGQGFDPKKNRNQSLGLIGIRERVQRLEGQLAISSSIGEGTQLAIKIPLSKGERGSKKIE
ncbi:GAF domain-containing sensor histidine kinase [Caldalkalibacillus mannanilyticus]|uniref:GAF domain-containing sensor histidine kinase n=1 Tax=Caldalkalibacillus mannanilyticus TaxID=1418 RepID=UPI00055892EF|nr:GAF domain-containing sensor histidine kinase [Caldalkalibacillus mannanilyticus]